jgi:hypothetical protein
MNEKEIWPRIALPFKVLVSIKKDRGIPDLAVYKRKSWFMSS